ncbi:MAG: MogA/MoaB family molybdenum cofactor biosynthesis protein [Methanobrevibacter boviskoreani]|jgi:molybdenum cofactor biosynthesis protein B|uniref:MogA/MoaB family molybdenum cofactor biosynthesis protein n=1 Tax=Methanobrevibacter boviskoreani TaxID=1348249 RepID=UPI000592FA8A|nr:MogA/MoaB family molybdenum cofactor biosynthesis protein [Methanobrevibacter boviskoreani]MCI6774578.1 MogA/MoaB family molybdenum cofactor biosynthesis protein [Methanobrevibacter boviskoreani]MCI6931010.1 MogA/MoaB family molybdenum cofactor biosynthesis protein [Methanobrevibacter boviskoreani]MDY5614095.1 MogA/MoaB family molybdenum cofactor biosynthesis protein [Methanobrevibacter boviskoreani]
MKSKSMEEHKKHVPIDVKCGVITLSDSKYKDSKEGINSDISGEDIINVLKEKGHEIKEYTIIPDDKDMLLDTVKKMNEEKIDAIFTTGGTGLESRDITIETLKPLYDKEINGFGEIFRLKSYEELGSGALLSRASAGIYNKTIIFSMPGSPNAVKTAMDIISDEIGHLVKHSRK